MKSTSHDIKKKIIERNSKSSPGKNIQKYKKTKQKHNNNQKHKTPVYVIKVNIRLISHSNNLFNVVNKYE